MSWYERWFADELYSELYAHRNIEEARQALDLFASVTGIAPAPVRIAAVTGVAAVVDVAPAPRVLDLACGSGRHAAELARRGYRVAAADLSATLLALARREIRHCEQPPSLIRADMRRLPFRGCFDAVLQLFTAFGYFAADAENEQVLHDVASLLLPGSWYMLDFLNAEEVQRNLVPRSEQKFSQGKVLLKRRISGDRVEKSITVIRGSETRHFNESVRLYTLDDFQRMFAQTDLTLQAVFGSYDGRPYGPDSGRCIMFARAKR